MSNTEKDLKTRSENKLQRPKQYVVVFKNDDFTPVEFVIEILMKVFRLSHEEATQKTFEIHKKGKGQVGPYTHEIAETRVMHTHAAARHHEFPLRCEIAEA